MSQNHTAISIAANMSKLMALVESGEFSPEDIADTLEGEELALADKFDGVMAIVRNLEGKAKTAGTEAKRLSDRAKSFENQARDLKKYILRCMQAAQLKTFKTERNTLTVRKGAVSVVIDNEAQLPDELVDVQTIVTPDRKKIKEALEALNEGETIPGAHLEAGEETLQVR